MYQGDNAKEQWSFLLSTKAKNLNNAIDEAYIAYKQFYDEFYGMTEAQVLATDAFSTSGYTEADILAYRNGYNVLEDFHKAMHNEAISQVDRFAYLVKFIG